MKRSRMNARSNPNRSNPDFWTKEVDGKKVWEGPVSNTAWLNKFRDVEGYKQAPQYHMCWASSEMRHQDVCAAQLYEECERCNVPHLYKYRIPVKRELLFKFNAVVEALAVDARRKGAKLREVKFRLTLQNIGRKLAGPK